MYETYLAYIIAYKKKKKQISLAFFYIAIFFVHYFNDIYIYAEIVMKFLTKTVQSA